MLILRIIRDITYNLLKNILAKENLKRLVVNIVSRSFLSIKVKPLFIVYIEVKPYMRFAVHIVTKKV